MDPLLFNVDTLQHAMDATEDLKHALADAQRENQIWKEITVRATKDRDAWKWALAAVEERLRLVTDQLRLVTEQRNTVTKQLNTWIEVANDLRRFASKQSKAVRTRAEVLASLQRRREALQRKAAASAVGGN